MIRHLRKDFSFSILNFSFDIEEMGTIWLSSISNDKFKMENEKSFLKCRIILHPSGSISWNQQIPFE
jgi:hypothetical protein